MKKLSVKECQQVELDILTNIDELCKKLNLRYYLAYGTLIGAVRHQGFIPWDDDLDIIMPRPDYSTLIDYFENNKKTLYPLKAVYVWHDYKYSYAMTRISDMRYKLDFTKNGPYSREDMGLFVDIYPYDGVGNEKDEARKIAKKSISVDQWITRSHDDFYTPTNNILKKKIQPLIYSYAHHVGEEHYHNHLMSIIGKHQYDDSRYVAPLTWDGEGKYFEKNIFGIGKDLIFCGNYFKVPEKYDLFLKSWYGNYMQLPPENERVASHFYDAYVRI